jgi:hypothetical protein
MDYLNLRNGTSADLRQLINLSGAEKSGNPHYVVVF